MSLKLFQTFDVFEKEIVRPALGYRFPNLVGTPWFTEADHVYGSITKGLHAK